MCTLGKCWSLFRIVFFPVLLVVPTLALMARGIIVRRTCSHENPATGHRLYVLQSKHPKRSGGKKLDQTGPIPSDKEFKINSSPIYTQPERSTSEDLNNLLQGMGLRPVRKKKKNTNTTLETCKQAHNQDTTRPSSPTYSTLLSQSYSLSTEIQLQYARNGHAVLRSILPPSLIHQVKHDLISYSNQYQLQAYRQKVEVATHSPTLASSCKTIQECMDILVSQYPASPPPLPFLQYFNTWRHVPSVYSMVTSTQMSHLAATLMDVPSVKLYQDSLFHKRSIDGPTPWHSDARMIPLDTSNMITFWIPLDDIPKGGTALFFVDKSHADFALPFWNSVSDDIDEKMIKAGHDEYLFLDQRYGGERHSVKHYMPLEVGDVTVHAGWTLHSAPEAKQEKDGERYALAVSYVDARAQVRHGAWEELVVSKTGTGKGYSEDRWSFQDWLKDVKPRKYFEHDLVPVVWPKKRR